MSEHPSIDKLFDHFRDEHARPTPAAKQFWDRVLADDPALPDIFGPIKAAKTPLPQQMVGDDPQNAQSSLVQARSAAVRTAEAAGCDELPEGAAPSVSGNSAIRQRMSRRQMLWSGTAALTSAVSIAVAAAVYIARRPKGSPPSVQFATNDVVNPSPWLDFQQPAKAANTLSGGDDFKLYVNDPVIYRKMHPQAMAYQWLLRIDDSVRLVACSTDSDSPVTYKSRVASHPGYYEYFVLVTSDHPTQSLRANCEGPQDEPLTVLADAKISALLQGPIDDDGQPTGMKPEDILRAALKAEFGDAPFSLWIDACRYRRQRRPGAE